MGWQLGAPPSLFRLDPVRAAVVVALFFSWLEPLDDDVYVVLVATGLHLPFHCQSTQNLDRFSWGCAMDNIPDLAVVLELLPKSVRSSDDHISRRQVVPVRCRLSCHASRDSIRDSPGGGAWAPVLLWNGLKGDGSTPEYF
jgi:hypothetical protein